MRDSVIFGEGEHMENRLPEGSALQHEGHKETL